MEGTEDVVIRSCVANARSAVANPRWRSLVAFHQSSEIKFEFGDGLNTLIANKLVRKDRE